MLSISSVLTYVLGAQKSHLIDMFWLRNKIIFKGLLFILQDEKPTGFLTVVPILFSSVLMALLCYTGPDLLADLAVTMKMHVEEGVFYGFLALFTASLLFPKMVARYGIGSKISNFSLSFFK